MQRPSLEGRSILVVEDEPLIVMDITQAFEATGAALTTTNTLKHALILVEHDGLSGAILDHALGGENSSFALVSRSAGFPSSCTADTTPSRDRAKTRFIFPSLPPRARL